MNLDERPIGFFDSGVGGISVLRESVKLLPNENFIYFGDSANAPYGIKSVEEVKKLSINAIEFLVKKNVKSIVVACNTATSVAIDYLRKNYKIPIIGIEPALKPAVELKRHGKIIIMATPVTLSEKKFNRLMNAYMSKADILPMPCPGLVELIESGILRGDKVRNYLISKIGDYLKSDIAAVVLGCTHYPFIKKELSNVIGEDVPIIDGSLGTAKQLKRRLVKYDILKRHNGRGEVQIYNSNGSADTISLSFKLLNYKDE